jgi:alpha-tubulin suppressor-like RCC1 family protein
MTNASNCGTCGKTCASGGSCSSGVCCASGQTSCGGTCTNQQTDTANCGTCDHRCATGQACSGGQCVCTTSSCSTGCCNGATCVASASETATQCGGGANGTCTTCSSGQGCCSGGCAALSTDARNCGTCDHVCATGQICTSGACCASGQSACNGACVDLQTDKANCGGCGRTCALGCAGGQCVVASSVSAGFYNTCARMSDTTVRCWGFNADGALGASTPSTSATPLVVRGVTGTALTNVNVIAVGFNYACAVHSDRTVDCWGYNLQGELGQGTLGGPLNGSSVPTPGPVVTLTGMKLLGVTTVAVGDQDSIAHTCAVVGGFVSCWGTNALGELGNGTSDVPVGTGLPLPQDVRTSTGDALAGATAVAVGQYHSCALVSGGMVNCWGSGALGNLSVDNPSTTAVPVLTTTGASLTGVTTLAAAGGRTCVTATGGAVLCWGDAGQALPTAILQANGSPLTGASSIDVSLAHACAVLANGTAQCWGDNTEGELGNGTTVSSSTPIAVVTAPGVPLTGVVSISTGVRHTCAVVTGGIIECWGDNAVGQLGDGTTNQALNPVKVVF